MKAVLLGALILGVVIPLPSAQACVPVGAGQVCFDVAAWADGHACFSYGVYLGGSLPYHSNAGCTPPLCPEGSPCGGDVVPSKVRDQFPIRILLA